MEASERRCASRWTGIDGHGTTTPKGVNGYEGAGCGDPTEGTIDWEYTASGDRWRGAVCLFMIPADRDEV